MKKALREGGKLFKEGFENIKHPTTVFAKAEKKSSISGLKDALSHFRSESGETVPANSTLIAEMKKDVSFRKDIFGKNGKITNIIKQKIEKALNEVKTSISSEKGSYTGGLWCTTLGGYSVKIEYNHVPVHGNNKVNLHLFGQDLWDFKKVEGAGGFHKLMHETIPGMIAGKGKDFYISYDFHHVLEIDVK